MKRGLSLRKKGRREVRLVERRDEEGVEGNTNVFLSELEKEGEKGWGKGKVLMKIKKGKEKKKERERKKKEEKKRKRKKRKENIFIHWIGPKRQKKINSLYFSRTDSCMQRSFTLRRKERRR